MSIDSMQNLIIKAENYFKMTGSYELLDESDIFNPLYTTAYYIGQELNQQAKEAYNFFNNVYDGKLLNFKPYEHTIEKALDDLNDDDIDNTTTNTLGSVAFYYWTKTSKAIYEFDSNMLKVLMNTEDVELHEEVFEYLPVNTFFISTPNYGVYDAILVHFDFGTTDRSGEKCNVLYAIGFSKNDPKVINNMNKNMDKLQDIGFHRKYIEFYQKHSVSNIPSWFIFRTGTKLSDIKSALIKQNNEMRIDYIDVYSENEIERTCEDNLAQYDVLKIAAMCSYYLCSKNKIVRPKKIKKADRKTRSNGSKLNFNFNECGGVVKGSRFISQQKQYINFNNGTGELNETIRKEMIPHIRRAHWHHYWVGNKNSADRHLELRWIEPIIINADKFDSAPAINRKI